jgi:ABC-2 type transport system ATP-binding protein
VALDSYTKEGTPMQERPTNGIPPKSVGDPAIAVRDVSKKYGAITAVDGLSFEVHPGRVTGFLGPNGAGKSTTLRIVLGLTHATSGTATVLGLPYPSLDHPTRVVGAVLETQSFDPHRSGRNHLRAIAATDGIPDERVDEVLALVDLEAAAGRKAGKYSLGMRQRLGLAGALLGDPGILVLDEPANGLDPQGIRWLRAILRSFAADGKAVLVSSHQLAEMGQLADDVVVIHQGQLVRQGTVAELTMGSRRLRVRSSQAERLGPELEAAGMTVSRNGDADLLLVDGGTAELVGVVALRTGAPLAGLEEEETTLEDAFLALTKEGER